MPSKHTPKRHTFHPKVADDKSAKLKVANAHYQMLIQLRKKTPEDILAENTLKK